MENDVCRSWDRHSVPVEEFFYSLSRTRHQERQSISHELHDQIGHTLTAINLYLYSAEQQLDRLPNADETRELLGVVSGLVSELGVNIRSVLRNLRLPLVSSSDLPSALAVYAEMLSRHNGVTCRVHVRNRLPGLCLKTEAAFRQIAQEAIVNAIQHAQAHMLTIDFSAEETPQGAIVRMIIADDGIGFDLAGLESKARSRYGLAIMRERAAGVGAALRIETQPVHGTQIIVEAAQ